MGDMDPGFDDLDDIDRARQAEESAVEEEAVVRTRGEIGDEFADDDEVLEAARYAVPHDPPDGDAVVRGADAALDSLLGYPGQPEETTASDEV